MQSRLTLLIVSISLCAAAGWAEASDSHGADPRKQARGVEQRLLEAAFARLDTNNDQRLSRSEAAADPALESLTRRCPMPLSRDGFQTLLGGDRLDRELGL